MLMIIFMTVIFLIGYSGIILESSIKIDKAASALIMSILMWVVYVFGAHQILSEGYSQVWQNFTSNLSGPVTHHTITNFVVKHEFLSHLADTASILLFLLGAMSIVEIIDRFQGFKIITDHIHTQSKVKLLWILALLGFVFSSALDNLTTTIVMVSLIRKLISKKEDRWIFASIVVIAANAGGAWSPIGDITTILLWIGGQITVGGIMRTALLPSLVNIIVPLIIASFFVRGSKEEMERSTNKDIDNLVPAWKSQFVLIVGLLVLIFVPVFKSITHLPPYIGMMFSLGVLWISTNIIQRKISKEDHDKLRISNIVSSIDSVTILYYAGILTAVAALSSSGLLNLVAQEMDKYVGNANGIDLAIGGLSSLIDNASLVAATMGMYNTAAAGTTGYMASFVQNGDFWTFLAYTAGTGGSMLIIGSAAGVAAMGMEKINFGWYLKKITPLAVAGYLVGALLFYLCS